MAQVDVFNMRINRTADYLVIKMHSPMLEGLMKQWSNGVTAPFPPQPDSSPIVLPENAHYYKVNLNTLQELIGSLSLPGGFKLDPLTVIFDGQRFNFTYLCAVGIKDGVEFKFKFPLSKSFIIRLRDTFRQYVKALLEEYAQPVDASLTLYQETEE